MEEEEFDGLTLTIQGEDRIRMALMATDMYCALNDMARHLRTEIKYLDNEALVPVRDKFYEILEGRNLDTEDFA